MSDTFDRSQLDGKDREQLSEIAGALGVKAISRMRKADLVDAIVAAAQSGNGGARRPPSRAGSGRPRPATDDLASLADEENALAGGDERRRRDGADPPPPPHRRSRGQRRHGRARGIDAACRSAGTD